MIALIKLIKEFLEITKTTEIINPKNTANKNSFCRSYKSFINLTILSKPSKAPPRNMKSVTKSKSLTAIKID